MTASQTPKAKMGLGKKVLIGVGILIGIGVIANIGKNKKGDKNTSSTEQTSTSENKTEEKNAAPTIGQTLKTDYFDVTVNKAGLQHEISTGNQFADKTADEGNQFLVFNTTFKNTDKESRMLTKGTVYITYNGKEYEFDKAETIMLEGWGLMLDQINPLTSKTTNLVYKIPKEITGPAYFRPGRADKDQRIFLGDLK
jgi:Domain of unknown function (DUF4352)